MLRYTFFFFSLFCAIALAAQTNTVSGQVNSSYGDEMGGLTIELLNADNQLIESQSLSCGDTYSFSNLIEGQNYSLRLNKDDYHLNGTSTYDLVLIVRHILGVDVLSNPFLVRAADIDDSGTVSIMDILRLRAWILAIPIELPANSWLFFQEDAGLEGPLFPFVSMGDQNDYNFTGVKRGDVNGSASPCQ